jgi:hypothetical protein
VLLGGLHQCLQQGRLVHQGAAGWRFGHAEQLLAVHQHPPAPQRPLGQRGQQRVEAHGRERFQARGHQGFAAEAPLEAAAGFHQGGGYPGAAELQGEGRTGRAGAHDHHPAGQTPSQTKEW